MKRYLVTGGTGFIGSSIVKNLIEEKNYVKVLDNEFRGISQKLTHLPNVEYVKADIRDAQKVEKACRNIDSIVHLAFINGTKFFYEKPELVLEVGVKGMINILDGAKKNEVKELFLASSSEVYQTPPKIPTPENVPLIIPDPHNPRFSYAGGKIISELLTLHNGAKIFDRVVIFRPHNVYGPNMGKEHVVPELILKILAEKETNKNITIPIQGDGSSTRAFIYIEDFANAFMLLTRKGINGEIYNIGTSEEVTINSLVRRLADIAKADITTNHSYIPEGSVQRRCPDVSKITRLGFSPKISLNNGLKKTFMWYNNDLNDKQKS